MDKALVDVLRSVRASSGEQAEDVTEVQNILMSNPIKLRVIALAACSVFSLCNRALSMLAQVEFAELDMPNGISAEARSMLEAVLIALCTCDLCRAGAKILQSTLRTGCGARTRRFRHSF